jgi:TPR repeat protein
MTNCQRALKSATAAIAMISVPAAPTLGQESSSWSSGTLTTPAQRPGGPKLLKKDAGKPTAKTGNPPAAAVQPTIGPGPKFAPSTTAPVNSLPVIAPSKPPLPAATSSPADATSTIAKARASDDAAYEAFEQGRYLTALDLARAAAEKGEPSAHMLIGRIYQDGLGVAVDPVLAAKWFRRGAELGDVESMFSFGLMLAEGEGIQKNRAGAGQMLEEAAQRGHALANYNLALLFLTGDGKPQNPHRAAAHLQFAEEAGVAAAQYDLATLYATGTGVTPSAFTASDWLRRAAEAGHTDAEIEYAIWLFQGRGVPVSQSAGAMYFRSAAEKGSPVAQNRLARCYAHGAGIQANPIEAAKWHLIAKAGGLADKQLEDLVAKLSRADRAKAQLAADEWIEKSRLN